MSLMSYKIEEADYKEEQLIMARLTGNFKRGNEKNKGSMIY